MKKYFEKKNNGFMDFRDVVSLKEYLETRLDAIEKATILASDNLKIRLDSLNEWRLQNKDERDNYITRDTFEAYQRIIWIGIGICIALELILKFIQ